MTRTRALLGVLAATALAACQTTGESAYEAPLIKAGLPVSGSNAKPRAQVDSTGTLTYDGNVYSVADLAPGTRPASDTDEAGWWMQMDRAEREVDTAAHVIGDPALNDYVRKVTCRVALEYCDDLRIYLVRRAGFNASMAPNGMMTVWSGLLLRARNEAQLATVLGHEFGHYLRRHSLQRMRDAIDKTNGLAFASFAFAAAGLAPIGTMVAAGVHGSIMAYGRDQEREADGYGLLFLYKAGYDTREAAKIWANLLRERDADPDAEQTDIFFSTHPESEERQAVLKRLGDDLQRESGATEAGREAYLAATLPHRAAWIDDELRRREFEQTRVLLEDLLVDDPNPAELHFFLGENHRLRAADGDNEKALEFYEKALADTGTAPPELYRSLGIVRLRMNEGARAADAFRRYLEQVPDSPDRLIIEQMIKSQSVS